MSHKSVVVTESATTALPVHANDDDDDENMIPTCYTCQFIEHGTYRLHLSVCCCHATPPLLTRSYTHCRSLTRLNTYLVQPVVVPHYCCRATHPLLTHSRTHCHSLTRYSHTYCRATHPLEHLVQLVVVPLEHLHGRLCATTTWLRQRSLHSLHSLIHLR